MMNLDVSKLFQVKNYSAGKEGNMLIFLVDKLTPVTVQNGKGKEVNIQVLICTAKVSKSEDRDKIEELVDCETPCTDVILVSKKFKRLSNKVQRALLEVENAKYNTLVARGADTNVDSLIYGEIAAVEKFGKLIGFYAINKADRIRKRSQKKACKGLHRQYKKDCKMLKNLQASGISDDDDFFDEEEFLEVPLDEVPKAGGTSSPEPEPAV